MKTKQIITVIFSTLLFSFTVQQVQAQLHLFKDNKTCLYGYTDSESNWIVPPQFDQAQELDRDYAIVTKNEKSGLINSEGEIIVPLIYSNIKNEYRFYILEKNGSYSIFDYRSGKIVTTDLPYKIKDFHEGNVIVHMGELYGLYANGNPVIRDVSYIQFEKYNIAKVYLGNAKNKQIKLFDLTTARYITANTYDQIEIYDSLCFIALKGNLYGAIDRKEKAVIAFKYNDYKNLTYEKNYSFLLTNTSKEVCVLFDKTGKRVTKKKYRSISSDNSFYLQSLFIAEYKNNYTLIDLNGKEVVPCIYDSIRLLEREDHMFVYILHSPKGYQLASPEGKILNNDYYPNINYLRELYAFTPEYFDDGTEDYDYEMRYLEPLPKIISIHADSSITWYDLEEETEYHFPGEDYSEENSCSGLIYYNGKYGLISPDMKHVLLPTYDFITPFKTGHTYTSVMNDGLFGMIGINGNTIIEPEHIFIEQNPFSEKSFITKNEDGRWGMVSTSNKTLIPYEYSAITGYDPELDYFWGIPEESTAWKIMNAHRQIKSPLSFAAPVLLSLTPYAIVNVYMPDEDIFKAGVMRCNTLEPLVPYEYEEIKRVNDSIFMCYTTVPVENALSYDLYIHARRIDSVHAVSILPNDIVAIKRKNAWGYFYHQDWIIAPEPSAAKNNKDHIHLLNMPFIDVNETRDSDGIDALELYLDTLSQSPIRILANNKALEVYCGVIKTETTDEETESTNTSITVFNDDYIASVLEEKEAFELEEYNHWGYNYYETYETRFITSAVLTDRLAEVRYVYESFDRHAHYIERADTLYTIKNNTLIPLSLGDITNHIRSNSVLSKLLLAQLDTLSDIQLPCSDRENMVELATSYQFQKDGIHFFYDDERGNSYLYDEIEITLPYADLIIPFKNSPYLKELYTNSLKP